MKSLQQYISESKSIKPTKQNYADYNEFVDAVNSNSKDITALKSQICNSQMDGREEDQFVELDFGTIIGYAHKENGKWKPETKVRLFNDKQDEEIGEYDMK